MKVIDGVKRTALAGCLVVIGLALGGCRENEQNRVLMFEKGKYLGKPDQPLSEDQIEELRHRAEQQSSS